MNTPTKRCRVCGHEFPYSELVKAKNCSGGVRNLCKACKRLREQDYYHADLEQARDKNAAKRRRQRAADPEKSRHNVREWRAGNPEAYQQSKRKSDHAYYLRHQEYLKTQALAYAKAHPENCRVRNARRRTRHRNAEGRYSAKDVAAQYAKQDGLCFWCAQPLTDFHVDHIIPLSRYGTNWPANIVCACPTCNHSKADKLPFQEWQPPNPLIRLQLPYRYRPPLEQRP